MNWLLSRGGDGGIADSSGDLPIHYAAIAGKPAAILTLVDKGKQDAFEFIEIFLCLIRRLCHWIQVFAWPLKLKKNIGGIV